MEIGEIYFWSATINNWQHLLKEDLYKNVIISSLGFLAKAKLIDVFAFVIMPNHFHIIWRINGLNGKETPKTSFLKYTAHEFKKILKTDFKNNLSNYTVDAKNKKIRILERGQPCNPIIFKRNSIPKVGLFTF